MKEGTRTPTKICFVIPSLHAGGMERVMSELIQHFSRKGTCELHLVLYGLNRDIFYRIPASIIIHRPKFRFNNRFRFLSAVRTLFYLRRKINQIQPYSVLSFGEYWNSFVLLATLGLRTNVFVSDRCQPDKSLGRFHDFLRRKLYPTSKTVIAQTSKAREVYSALFNSEMKVIANPIRRINQNGSITRENIVLSVGRLIDTKHHDRLIRIFLSTVAPGWRLVIVGDNALKQNVSDSLSDLIAKNGAEEKVILAGKQSDVDKFYLQSKIFAFTSSSEGFPNVVGEAMSAGLPVISYDCIAGPSEMIRDGLNGFLVPLFDDEVFKERLQLLIDNEALRVRMGIRAQIDVEKFGAGIIGDKFLSLLTT